MKKKPLPPRVLAQCRYLREEGTDAERKLWNCLRNRTLGGYKFRRQHPVGPYILDFYCIEKGLAIEIDGGGHTRDDQVKHDQERTEFLYEQGIKLIRFWNQDVKKDLQAVLEVIWRLLQDEL